MTLGRRFELLMANAARNIPAARRRELLDAAANWMESDGCPAKSAEELFYLFGGTAGMHIVTYSEEIQAKIGAEIIEKELRS